MKILFFIVVFLMVGLTVSFAKINYNNIDTIVVTKLDTQIIVDANNPKLKRFYVKKNQMLIEQGKLFNDHKTGVWRFYNDNGFPIRIEEYLKGLKEGIYYEFDNTGAIKYDYNYKAGLLEGTNIEYYSGGRIKQITNYKGGQLNGTKMVYYETGTLQEKSEWKDGLKDGITQFFFPDNYLAIEYTYVGGLLNGLAKIFEEKGILGKIGYFVADKENGEWTWYNLDGSIQKIINYLNGLEIKE
jgi:antitoxin component YwqK of YwqJK toxin-antitoxin module